MKLYSICFSTYEGLKKVLDYLFSQRFYEFRVYCRVVPQITFAEKGNDMAVNVAFLMNDLNIKGIWIQNGTPVEQTTWNE